MSYIVAHPIQALIINGLSDFLTQVIVFPATAAVFGGGLMGFTGNGILIMVPRVALEWGPAQAIMIFMIVATFAAAYGYLS